MHKVILFTCNLLINNYIEARQDLFMLPCNIIMFTEMKSHVDIVGRV